MELFCFDDQKRFIFRAMKKVRQLITKKYFFLNIFVLQCGEGAWEWEGVLEQGNYLLIPYASG
jgi:hypothetical protein